jgi:hypothetical protein
MLTDDRRCATVACRQQYDQAQPTSLSRPPLRLIQCMPWPQDVFAILPANTSEYNDLQLVKSAAVAMRNLLVAADDSDGAPTGQDLANLEPVT